MPRRSGHRPRRRRRHPRRRPALARHDAGGALDIGFGGGGSALVLFGGKPTAEPQDIAVQQDGGILVAGYAGLGNAVDFAVSRFTAEGLLDATFGTDGTAFVDVAGGADRAFAVLVQPDGGIVLAGWASAAATGADYAAVRLTSSGELDTSFGAGGRASANLLGATDLGAAGAVRGVARPPAPP